MDQVRSEIGSDEKVSLVVLPDPETLARVVAAAVLAEAHLATRRGGRFAVALSGGKTPRRVYELLGRSPFEEEMPWDVTEVYWSDERCVDPQDLRSNELMAREALLDHIRLPESQVHPMRCPEPLETGTGGSGRETKGDGETDGSRAVKAAAAYERLLRSRTSGMDLVLLGLGEDGHTASLFPGSEALAERDRWVVAALGEPAGGDAGGEQTPLWRVTLTPDYINRAANVFFMVSGAAKAAAVRKTLEGSVTDAHVEATGEAVDESNGVALPARSIKPANGSLSWFLDEAAASEIHAPALPPSGKESPR